MKVFAVSDLHLSINNPKPMDIFGGAWENYVDDVSASWTSKVGDDDVVLIAGDVSWAMTLEAAVPDLDFIAKFPGQKVILRGNHDYWWKAIGNVRRLLPAGMHAVQNDCIRIGSLLVCGSRGWTSPEGKNFTGDDQKIYDREIIRLRMSLEAMDKLRKDDDRVVAMTHYPPFNSRFDPSQFTELFGAFGVPAVVYGHLHGKDCRVERLVKIGETAYYLTSCDLIGNDLVEIPI